MPHTLQQSLAPPPANRFSGVRPRIIVAEANGFSPEALARLASWAEVELLDADRPALEIAAARADVLWVRLRHLVDHDLFARAPRLACLVTPTTGLNHIDLEAATHAGVRVLSLRGECDFLRDIRATAELTIGLMLSLLRHIPAAVAHAAGGGWNRDLFQGRELYQKTIGLVGYGRLGKIVARYLVAFGARVVAYDPYVPAEEWEPGVKRVTFAELLAESELVSLHASLTPETEAFFGARQFEALRRGSWFVNTARGELVDEAALLAALSEGRLAGAALDVLCQERATGMGDHAVVAYARSAGNLLLTPHLGGCTEESMRKTEAFMAERLSQWWLERISQVGNP